MTIASQTSRIAYTGDGVTTAFSVPFYFQANADIVVYLQDSLGNITSQALGTHYNLSGVGASAGGTCTFVTAPAAATTISIYRDPPVTQTTSYNNNDPFPAKSHENALDKGTTIDQRTRDIALRGIRLPDGEGPTSTVLSSIVNRKNKLLGFGTNGELVNVLGPSYVGGTLLASAVLDSRATAAVTTFPASTSSITTQGYAAAGDLGGANYIRVASQPAHTGRFRSADRFLPNGATDNTNGGWWAIVGTAVNPFQFGAIGDDTTTDTSAFQGCLDYVAVAGAEIFVPQATYKLTTLTVSNANTTIRMAKNAILNFPVVGTSANAITVNANYFRINGGAVKGPTAGTYVGMENGISMIGTSAAVRKTGFTIEDCEVYGFGAHGIYGQYLNLVDIDRCHLRNCGYAGALFLSCDEGRFTRNYAHDITPGQSANMYGLSLTFDSTNFAADPNKGTKQALDPFCTGWFVAFNFIENIAWEGIDTHGVFDTQIVHNRVYATKQGIACTTGSNAAAQYAGYDNIVAHNTVDARNADGTLSGYEWQQYGINCNGGNIISQTNVVCEGNIVRYKGIISNPNTGCIMANNTVNIIISNNVIEHWNGVAILVTAAGANVSGNRIGGVVQGGDTVAICVYDAGPSAFQIGVSNNVVDIGADIAPRIGFSQVVGATFRPMLSGNNFSACSVGPFDLGTAGFCLGTDVRPILTFSAGTNTIAMATMNGGDCDIFLTSGATYNITTFTGFGAGQSVMIRQLGSSTATLVRDGAAIKTIGGANINLAIDEGVLCRFGGGGLEQLTVKAIAS